MKLLLVLSSIFLVASGAETLYLKLKLNKVNPKIADSLLNVSHLVPGLVESNIPDQYSNVAPVVMKYLKNISVVQHYHSDSQTSEIVVYFPGVPAELNDQVLPVLQSYTNNAPVTEILAGLLPTYLKCGQCESNGLEAGLDGSTSVPAPAPVWPGSIVGLQLIVNGTDKSISQSLIDLAKSQFPKLIDDELQKVVNLDSVQKKILKDFVNDVDVAQTIDAGKLKLRLMFPRVPSSYIELYRPLFDMYVVQNTELINAVEKVIPVIVGCTGCSLESFQLFNDKITSTSSPTASPTAPPTASLKGNSASSLSVGFGLLMTIVAVAV